MEEEMNKFNMIMSYDPDEFVQEIDTFVKDKIVIQSNFQRNLFYPRADFDESGNPTWGNELQETFTAFILYRDAL